MQTELDMIRRDIDEIDAKLLELFKLRMDCAARVAEYKRRESAEVLQSGREEQILSRAELEAGETLAPYARELFTELMRLSREYQKQIMSGDA